MAKVVKKNKKNIKNNKNLNNEKFSFDNEIVIGVTKIPETKKVEKNSKDLKKKNNKTKVQKEKTVKEKKAEKRKENIKKTKAVKVKNNVKQVKNEEKIEKEYKKVKNKRPLNMKLIKYIIIAILFVILIICAMFSPLFNIKTILTEGNETITEEKIISLSQIKTEENIFKINKGKTEKLIKENPYIESVQIDRKLPSTVILKIEERKPAYILELAGNYVYLDKQGYILQISQEKLELPILQGAETIAENLVEGNRLIKEDLEKLSLVLKIMEAAQINQIDNLITRIDMENKEDFKLIFETEAKTAYIGDTTNLITKIPTIKLILEEEQGKAGEIFVNMDLNSEYPIFRQSV